MQDILDMNSDLTKIYLRRRQLTNKYGKAINLYGHFDRFFSLAEHLKLSTSQVEQYLINASNEIAFIYCSSLSTYNIQNNKKYIEYFPLMLSKLSNNIDYLYTCLFKSNYWYIVSPIIYWHDYSELEHLSLLSPYLENIFSRHGYELYKRCKRGYNKMLAFFILFHEYFADEMLSTFIQLMYKKIQRNPSIKSSIIEYLKSDYIRIPLTNKKWQSLQLLLNL